MRDENNNNNNKTTGKPKQITTDGGEGCAGNKPVILERTQGQGGKASEEVLSDLRSEVRELGNVLGKANGESGG